jgi:adenosylcobyric acid synthase
MSARPRARAIMLQATGSHAGKTVLTAGFCRLLARRGLRVAPFKAQNMSLNAHVAVGGGEMGWAQVMQAEAAGVAPRVEMNPILLKPRTEARSQVVLLGRVLREADARAYYRLASTLWPAVRRSYETLAREADVVVIEGAGSPAEPNLMRRDLANMRVARLARAPVLLVGDIDRGGVFASLLGTTLLLSPPDRRRLRGFVINKFRGDASLLAPALRDLTRRTRVPVVGVVPFLARLDLPEEDSVALDAPAAPSRDGLSIVVLRLPHIANFTDFAPLESEPGVRVAYAEAPRDAADATLVILPGSKDTIADLRALKARGFARALEEHRRRGGRVLGICGGYQMLGRAVTDPHHVESGGAEAGLDLLPVTTTLAPEKVTRRVRARWRPDGPDFEGYELHAGETTATDGGTRPLLEVDGRPEGCVSLDERVWGTYVHGLFESGGGRRRVLDWARDGGPATLAPAPVDHRALREASYERVADTLAACIEPRLLREIGA